MKFLPFLFLIPLIAFAQTSEVMVGSVSVPYDERFETESGILYYQNNQLVASEHDFDGNGASDTWLKYSGEFVELEATDTDGDGTADVFTSVTADGEVIGIEGEGAGQFDKPEIIEFADRISGSDFSGSDEEDLVGSLDKIDIPKAGLPWGLIFIVVIISGGGYWLYRKKKAVEEV